VTRYERVDPPELTEAEAAAQDAADAAVRRLVHLALLGTGMGTLVGTATVLLAMVGVLQLQATSPPTESTAVLLIAGGTMGGLFMAAVSAWWILAPLGNWYRRGMLATVSAFATVLVMLLAFPLRALFGPPGLVTFAILCLIGALLLARRARSLAT
jgi:hypothetical protein